MTNTIGFPGLNLEFEINRVAFHIFSKPIYYYALIILTGFLLGLLFVSLTCKKRGVEPDAIFDIAFWGLIFGIVGARIYYCIFDVDGFKNGFLDIFKIWEGGLAIYGGIIGAIISTSVYCKKHKLSILKVFDVACPGLLIGQAIGRWGNFVNAEVFGRETNSLLRMTINNNIGVHPLFLYESLWNILGFILIVIFRDKKKADGQVFFSYILWYGTGRLFLEGMRQSEYILWLIDDKIGISQAVALICIIVSLFFLFYLPKKQKNK